MASIMPNPTSLSNVTRFPPNHARTFSRSRSPSRSPVRKAQFAARELDPLLQNLSPDATLNALQKTNTIAGSPAEQTALAKSISDASETERELGIRAAIAAKNLRQWFEEVSSWSWPNREDRAWGAGFISPVKDVVDGPTYLGCLPESVVKHHDDRLDEIWDAIETLGMDDLKDYVFSSHNPRTSSTSSETSKPYPSSYGRMRDFTALVTAIVIQSLPVQANLLILLDTWSIRLTVLREIPALLARFEQVKLALGEIRNIIQDPNISRLLTKNELDTAKAIFQNKVSRLGKCVDVLLDQLEGQEDSLPQAWLDSLDDIENKYAEWVSQADQVVLRNQMTKANPKVTENTEPPDVLRAPGSTDSSLTAAAQTQEGSARSSIAPGLLPEVGVIKRKPLQETNLQAHHRHKRGVSEISAAESALSGYSFENAEIIDAVETKVMPSPRISVIDHQIPADKASIPWMRGGLSVALSPTRPGMPLQRASTASIEVIPKHQIREVVLRRSASHDLLSSKYNPLRSTSHAGLVAVTSDSPRQATYSNIGHSSIHLEEPPESLTPLAVSPSPSLMVDPLNLKGKELGPSPIIERPSVPRRSSKRLSMPLLNSYQPPVTPPHIELTEPEAPLTDDMDKSIGLVEQHAQFDRHETFDEKLKNILASMPTKFRLAAGSESGRSSRASSETSTRASSPVQIIRLSPVKDRKSGHYQSTSGIRVYNLSKTGKSRDSAPIKLFVRAVGEHGERVMVRVGGGWADLAEYLREYSLHHGGRDLKERKLEVAGYPGGQPANTQRGSPSLQAVSNVGLIEHNFDFGLSPSNGHGLAHANKSVTSINSLDHEHISPVRPPPVPLMQRSDSPAMRNRANSTQNQHPSRSSTPAMVSRPGSRISVHTSAGSAMTTAATSGNNYTPLGGAGPVQNNRRAVSNTYIRTPSNEAWVNGMVNQARAVSGSHAQRTSSQSNSPSNIRNNIVVSTPTTTTTTIVSSRVRGSNPGSSSKRVSAVTSPAASASTPTQGPRELSIPTVTPTLSTTTRPIVHKSPVGSESSKMSSNSSGSYATANTAFSKGKKTDADGRRRSMMSLGDVGGIRRVFLRKKSEMNK